MKEKYFGTGARYFGRQGKYREKWALRPIDGRTGSRETQKRNRKWFGPRELELSPWCRSAARERGGAVG
ncbi:MAG: hypothetical protein DMG42_32450 [Acidobacteria bacterium]|nr:MAG: hypothetical protein DMG42_32450 [Acidobacteriota bacterium]